MMKVMIQQVLVGYELHPLLLEIQLRASSSKGWVYNNEAIMLPLGNSESQWCELYVRHELVYTSEPERAQQSQEIRQIFS